MELKITSVRTIWFGVSESQFEDLQRLIRIIQFGDLHQFGAKMNIAPKDMQSAKDTLRDFQEVLKECQGKIESMG